VPSCGPPNALVVGNVHLTVACCANYHAATSLINDSTSNRRNCMQLLFCSIVVSLMQVQKRLCIHYSDIYKMTDMIICRDARMCSCALCMCVRVCRIETYLRRSYSSTESQREQGCMVTCSLFEAVLWIWGTEFQKQIQEIFQ
jgi:hypothetical protein